MAFPSILLAITLAILHIFSLATAIVEYDGTFSIDLIHRDSIKSPFYDRSMSYSQRVGHALQRSFINTKRVDENCGPNRSKYQTEIIPEHGEYIVNISYGTPPHQVQAIADTGSDLSWIQCEPCIQCYKQKAKMFNPRKSSTYRTVPCETKTCLAISTIEKYCSKAKNCLFSESYADGTVSNGLVARESVTLGDKVLPNVIFGCGFHNDGGFRDTWGGIVGLGGGDYSLVSQIRSLVPGKFSYCLIPFPQPDDLSEKSSKMTFGITNFGPNFVSTPIVPIFPKTFYHVTLEGVSVNGERFNIHDAAHSTKPLPKGNMIVDSGTTLTMLPTKVYNEVEAAIRKAVKLRIMQDPQKVLTLCYRYTKVFNVPKVVMHFEGADVEFTKDNIFVTVSDDTMCLAMASTTDLSVYGNLAQQNFMVGYDLENNRVYFKQTDCEKL